MKLENIPFRDYLKMNEAEAYVYTYSLKFGATLNRAIDHMTIGDLQNRTFGEIKDLQLMFDKGLAIYEMVKPIAMLTDKEESEIYKMGIVEVSQTFAYIRDSIAELNEAERQRLTRALTDKEVRAGIDRFEDYSVYPQFRSLALTFGLTINEVRNMPYSEAFLELCYAKDLAEYQEAYGKLK